MYFIGSSLIHDIDVSKWIKYLGPLVAPGSIGLESGELPGDVVELALGGGQGELGLSQLLVKAVNRLLVGRLTVLQLCSLPHLCWIYQSLCYSKLQVLTIVWQLFFSDHV